MGHGYDFKSQEDTRPWEIHPIWRGFGCIMVLLIPLMAYAAASLIIDLNTEQNWGFPVPVEMARTVDINFALPYVDNPGINLSIPHFYGNLVLGAVLMLIGYGILMFIYILLYSMMGPPRLGPLDAKPVRKKPKKRRRDWKDERYRY